MSQLTKQQQAQYIDHTNLSPTATFEDIKKLCEEAIKYQFKSVCINPYYVQYAKQNIRCNAVLPGLIATDAAIKNMSDDFIDSFLKHVPLHRFGQPEDIANAVLFLVSDDSSFITGQLLEVAGGFGIASPMYGELTKK